MKYCGIDLHWNNSVVLVSDEKDRVVLQKRLPNELGQIQAALEPHRDELVGVVVESTFDRYWLVDGLMDAGYRGTSGAPERDQEVRGAEVQRGLRRCRVSGAAAAPGLVGRGLYLSAGRARGARPFAKRLQLVRYRTAQVLSIENILARQTGARLSSEAVKRLTAAQVEELGFAPDVALAVEANRAVSQALAQQIAALEQRLKERVRLRGEFKLLKTTPGVGDTLATTIMLEMGTPTRFAKVGNFSSYCRCVDSLRESNEKKKGEGNAKNGNKYLAWAFVEAANFARRYCPQAKSFYERKKRKTNGILATKALAHKLARACYHMLREQKPFDVSRCFG